MSRVTVTVPIQLVKDAGSFWLQVEAPSEDAATIELAHLGSELIEGIFGDWAEAAFKEAQLKGRRPTGLRDTTGQPVFEGDIVRVRHSEQYPSATGVVTWAPMLGAFVLQGKLEQHGDWSTQNLQGIGTTVIIGNVFESPECYQPAVCVMLPVEKVSSVVE